MRQDEPKLKIDPTERNRTFTVAEQIFEQLRLMNCRLSDSQYNRVNLMATLEKFLEVLDVRLERLTNRINENDDLKKKIMKQNEVIKNIRKKNRKPEQTITNKRKKTK